MTANPSPHADCPDVSKIECRQTRECAPTPYPEGRPAKLVDEECEADTVRFGWSVPKSLVDGDRPAKSCTRGVADCCTTGSEGMSELCKTAHASSQKRTGEYAGCGPMLKGRGPRRSVEDEMLVESMGLPQLPLLDRCRLSLDTALEIELARRL